MSQIKVTWKAFGESVQNNRFISSVEFETEFAVEDAEKFCEVIYHVTNTKSGNLWSIIQPKLSATRTHTSISVGDEITIDGQVYICADLGFEKIEDVEIKYHGDSVFRVSKREVVA